MDKSVFSNKPFLFILITCFLSATATPREQERIQGANQSMQSVTRILGPIFAAFLYQKNHSFPWITCVILSLIGAFLLYNHKNTISKHLHET